MRTLFLAGASLLALTTPAFAQQVEPPADAQSGQLDTLEPADDQPVKEAPKPTGDPILDRLNALEARVSELETENAQLRQQAELNQSRLETVETRAAKNAQFGWALSAFAFGYALLQTPSGMAADRLGARRILAAIVAIWSVFTGLTALAWNFVSLLVIRFLFGAGEAGAFPGMARALR